MVDGHLGVLRLKTKFSAYLYEHHMIIGLDFDNTIICYDNLLYHCAREKMLIDATCPRDKTAIRDRVRQLPEGEMLWQSLQCEAYGKRIDDAEVKPGVLDFLCWCRQNSLQVYIISHKSEYAAADKERRYPLQKAALNWMWGSGILGNKDIGLSEEAILFKETRHEKIKAIDALGCEVFVDDLIETFQESGFGSKTRKILYTQSEKSNLPEDVELAHDWQTIQYLVGSGKSYLFHVVSTLTGKEKFQLDQLAGGRNSRVYRLTDSRGNTMLAKHYFRHLSDPRDRGKTEFSAYRLLRSWGIDSVPEPLMLSPDHRVGFYEFIPGKRIRVADKGVLDHFVGFIEKIVHAEIAVDHIKPASEACFCGEDILKSISHRRFRLGRIADNKLSSFLFDEFDPGANTLIAEVARSEEFKSRVSLHDQFPSPSDFGFHNALLVRGNKMVFVDFEYFGRDDPAKMICDFLLHPAMGLTLEHQQYFYNRVQGLFNFQVSARARTLFPLHGLKWCLLLLNEFVQDDQCRRDFAVEKGHGKNTRHVQLDKARQLLGKLLSGEYCKIFTI